MSDDHIVRTPLEAVEIYDALRVLNLWETFYDYAISRPEDDLEVILRDFLMKDDVFDKIMSE